MTKKKKKTRISPLAKKGGWYKDQLVFGYSHIPQELWDNIFQPKKDNKNV